MNASLNIDPLANSICGGKGRKYKSSSERVGYGDTKRGKG